MSHFLASVVLCQVWCVGWRDGEGKLGCFTTKFFLPKFPWFSIFLSRGGGLVRGRGGGAVCERGMGLSCRQRRLYPEAKILCVCSAGMLLFRPDE